MKSVVLASESPRRRELMNISGIPFTCAGAKIDETLEAGMSLCDAVMKIAKKKAQAVQQKYAQNTIIGADTMVVIDDVVLGKPKDDEDAKKTLQLLSGKTHEVITGVAILHGEEEECFCETTRVMFRELSDEEIDAYIKTREHYDKAGSYAIQGKGMMFVERIEGDYSNVVGLPMCHLIQVLKKYIEA